MSVAAEAPSPAARAAVRAALVRTRPWMTLLAVILLLAGVAGLAANPRRAHVMIAMAAGTLVVALPLAVVQVNYAMALSDVANALDAALEARIERACSSQRNLWVVTAVVMGLGAVLALLRTLAVFF